MSIASPSYRGYAVQTALMLSQERKVVCDWQHYHLELTQQEQEEEEESKQTYTLTIAVAGQAPHIEKTFGWIGNVKGFLRDYELPASGWLPVEFARKPAESNAH